VLWINDVLGITMDDYTTRWVELCQKAMDEPHSDVCLLVINVAKNDVGTMWLEDPMTPKDWEDVGNLVSEQRTNLVVLCVGNQEDCQFHPNRNFSGPNGLAIVDGFYREALNHRFRSI